MRYLIMGLVTLVFAGGCVLIGILIGVNRLKKAIEESSVGDLRIDRSESDEPPRPYLEVYKGNTIESISQKKFVILNVVNEDYLSRD